MANLLFVCSRNKWRSPTAEAIYKNNPDHNIRSAGTEPSARIRLNEKLLNWADIVFVMEKKHRDRIFQKFSDAPLQNKIVILDIPDDYQFMDEELVADIKSKVDLYLNPS